MSDATQPSRREARSIEIARFFDAPRSRVYDAWADSARMAEWAAPHGFTITEADGDLRPGGAWRSCMSSPEGEELGLGGVYLEVVPNELLCFLHAWDDANGAPGEATRVTVTFEDVDERITRMVFRQTGFTSDRSMAEHAARWTECFERLAPLVTRPAPPRAMATRRRSASL